MTYKLCSKCQEEKDFSLFYYVKGKPGSWCKTCCRNAHVAYASTDRAKAKNRERRASAEYKLKKAALDKRYRETDREAKLQKKREYYRANKDKHSKRMAELYAANRDKVKQRVKEWVQNNREKSNRYGLERHARKLRARPAWFGELDVFIFEEAAELALLRARLTGLEWEVDHIVPLRGKTVSGLHVWSNVQVIPQTLNASKRNRFNGTPETYAFGLHRK